MTIRGAFHADAHDDGRVHVDLVFNGSPTPEADAMLKHSEVSFDISPDLAEEFGKMLVQTAHRARRLVAGR